ncbi:MAG: RNA polymerase sigma factor [Chitinophagales bacterium]|jgi:RNA polymerase sigma factor (sigma-70 family)|nr:RNA polymerase sigma factor [Chitinophagales bacterium]
MSDIQFQGYSEQQIREGCFKGDRRFQQMLYDMFSSKMFGVCMRYANEYNAAQDLLQEGFVKVFRNIDKFRGEGSFEGWVRRIFVNTAIEHYRKQVNLYAIVDNDLKAYENYDNNALETLKEQDIVKMIQKLSHGYRTVFNLYVVEGYSHKEIGDLMGISEGTSKSQLARARYLLQKMITEQFGDVSKSSIG